MPDFAKVKNTPGVYLLLDLDGRPLYAGKSSKVRKRLEQHFIRQDSSVTADGLLDVYEVGLVKVWYADRKFPLPLNFPDEEGRLESLDLLEIAVYTRFKPLWNRARLASAGTLPDLSLDNADATIE